jgi:Domain of unknown function (DUF4145)
MTENRRIAFCPHCGHRSPQKVVFTQQYEETIHDFDGGSYNDVPSTYHVLLCEICNQLILRNHWNICRKESCMKGGIQWPHIRALHEAVPKRIREIYQEANSIKRVAPNAFAVQIRRALEALCEDRGVHSGSLNSRLQELVSRGELPAVLAEVTNVLRLLGNIGAHAAEVDVNLGQVPAIDEFFRAIIEYVYVAPYKVQSFRKELEKLKKDGGTQSA